MLLFFITAATLNLSCYSHATNFFIWLNNNQLYAYIFSKDAYIWITMNLNFFNQNIYMLVHWTAPQGLGTGAFLDFRYFSLIHPVLIMWVLCFFCLTIYFKNSRNTIFIKTLILFSFLGFFWSFFNDYNLVFWNWDYVEFLFFILLFFFIILKHTKHTQNYTETIILLIILFRNMFFMSTHHISGNESAFFLLNKFSLYTMKVYTLLPILLYFLIFTKKNKLHPFLIMVYKGSSTRVLFIGSFFANLMLFEYLIILVYSVFIELIKKKKNHLVLILFIISNIYWSSSIFSNQSHINDYVSILMFLNFMLLFILNSLTLYMTSDYIVDLGGNIMAHNDITLHLIVSTLTILINYNSETLDYLFHLILNSLSHIGFTNPNLWNDVDLSTNFDIESVFFLVTDFLEYTLQDFNIVFDWIGIALYQYLTPKE